jgi:hypothetical protein
MSIRSWFGRRRKQADADAVRRAQDENVETAEERAHGRGDRWGEAADERFARRIGESPDDVSRLGDFNP